MAVNTVNGNGRYPGRDPEFLTALGTKLRVMRQARKQTQRQVGALLSCDHSAVSMIEAGKYPSLTDDMARRIEDLLAWASDGHEIWFMSYLEVEQSATSLRGWEGPVIPGLFQAADYARHVLSAAAPGTPSPEIERQVAARMKRQEIWAREDPPPPVLSVVVGETALRRAVGSPGVMREQLGRLADMSAHPSACVRVLPFGAGGSVGLLPSFMLASFAPDPRPDAAYLDDALIGRTIPGRTPDERTQIAKLGLVYDRLAAEALSPGDSSALIRKAAGEWT